MGVKALLLNQILDLYVLIILAHQNYFIRILIPNAMKCLRTCLFLLAIASISYSQAPQAFNYQAILRNSDGTIKVNETVVLQIGIIHGHTDGPPVYLEIHNTTTSELGMVNLVIGEGETSDDLSTIDWAGGPYYLEISVDGRNMGTSPLLSVPYALYAASGNEGPQGSPGEKGPQGEPGPPGPSGEPDPELLERIRLLESMNGIGTMIDIEGNEYTTVKIGDQVWMAENLRVTRYADGAAIPLVEDGVSWRSLAITDRAYCWVGNGDSLAEIYGTFELHIESGNPRLRCSNRVPCFLNAGSRKQH